MKARNDVGNIQTFNKHFSYPQNWREREKSNMASVLGTLVALTWHVQ